MCDPRRILLPPLVPDPIFSYFLLLFHLPSFSPLIPFPSHTLPHLVGFFTSNGLPSRPIPILVLRSCCSFPSPRVCSSHQMHAELLRLMDVNSPTFFEAEWQVSLSWEDPRITASCFDMKKGQTPEHYVCEIIWKPTVRPTTQLPPAALKASQSRNLLPSLACLFVPMHLMPLPLAAQLHQ